MMEPIIASVTVSKNAKSLISNHLHALLSQTYRLTEIVVVDNASTDGTAEFVAEHFPSATLIRLEKNEGVGGGFSVGLEYAVSRKYDWVWMFGQDSIPPPETLEKLLSAYRSLPDLEHVGLVAPLPVDVNSRLRLLPFRWKDGQVVVLPSSGGETVTFVDMVISSGSLIRSEAIKKVGLPRRDFFIDFVDYEHCLRLRQHGYLIAVVNNCFMAHTIGHPRRVKLFGKPMSWTTHAPWRDYYKVRNRAFVVWHQFPSARAKIFVVRKFLTQTIGTLLFDPQKSIRVKLMWRGLRDGILGRLGIQVAPTDS